MTRKQPKTPTPPKHLSTEARALWRAITADYDLDAAALAILGGALEAFDRMREAQGLLKADGLVVVDRFNQQKPHPAVSIERDSRQAVLRGLTALGLDLEPIHDGPGRPAGGG